MRAGILLHSNEKFLFPGAMMCKAQVTTNGKTSHTGFLSMGFPVLPHLTHPKGNSFWFVVYFSEALLKLRLNWDALKISLTWRKGHGSIEKSQQVYISPKVLRKTGEVTAGEISFLPILEDGVWWWVLEEKTQITPWHLESAIKVEMGRKVTSQSCHFFPSHK